MTLIKNGQYTQYTVTASAGDSVSAAIVNKPRIPRSVGVAIEALRGAGYTNYDIIDGALDDIAKDDMFRIPKQTIHDYVMGDGTHENKFLTAVVVGYEVEPATPNEQLKEYMNGLKWNGSRQEVAGVLRTIKIMFGECDLLNELREIDDAHRKN